MINVSLIDIFIFDLFLYLNIINNCVTLLFIKACTTIKIYTIYNDYASSKVYETANEIFINCFLNQFKKKIRKNIPKHDYIYSSSFLRKEDLLLYKEKL